MSRPATKPIAKTLAITTDFAFKLLRKGKWRRASNIADDTLRQLPPRMRKTADALFLRMIGSSARHIADWYAAEDSARRKRKKRTRRKQDKRPRITLLLIPESPAAESLVAEPKPIAVERE